MSDKLKLENQICHRFYVASNAITRAYRPLLDELDLTYPQYIVMLTLWEHKQSEVGKIQALTKIDPGALSLILKKLENKNVILLQPSEQDKRVKCVLLTSQGQALQEQALEIPNKLMCKVSGVDVEEMQQLTKMLDKVIANIDSE